MQIGWKDNVLKCCGKDKLFWVKDEWLFSSNPNTFLIFMYFPFAITYCIILKWVNAGNLRKIEYNKFVPYAQIY